MYNEKKMKFWAIMEIIKKWFIVLILTIIGLILGFVISEFVVDVLNELPMYRTAFIGGTAFVGFFIGLLLTSNVERNIQDAYWKIEVMHKLDEIGIEELSEETGLSKVLEDKKTFKDKIVDKLNSSKNDNNSNIQDNKSIIETKTNIEQHIPIEVANSNNEQKNSEINNNLPNNNEITSVSNNTQVSNPPTTTTPAVNSQNTNNNIAKKAKVKYKSKKGKMKKQYKR